MPPERIGIVHGESRKSPCPFSDDDRADDDRADKKDRRFYLGDDEDGAKGCLILSGLFIRVIIDMRMRRCKSAGQGTCGSGPKGHDENTRKPLARQPACMRDRWSIGRWVAGFRARNLSFRLLKLRGILKKASVHSLISPTISASIRSRRIGRIGPRVFCVCAFCLRFVMIAREAFRAGDAGAVQAAVIARDIRSRFSIRLGAWPRIPS